MAGSLETAAASQRQRVGTRSPKAEARGAAPNGRAESFRSQCGAHLLSEAAPAEARKANCHRRVGSPALPELVRLAPRDPAEATNVKLHDHV